jgi:hypothetical protein
VKNTYSDSNKQFSKTDIIKMLEFLINNIFVAWWTCSPNTIGIPVSINDAPLQADLFLYLYEVDFMQEILKKNEKNLAQSLNFMLYLHVFMYMRFQYHMMFMLLKIIRHAPLVEQVQLSLPEYSSSTTPTPGF